MSTMGVTPHARTRPYMPRFSRSVNRISEPSMTNPVLM